MNRCPGPGDEITWPAYAGHPNDPRAPDDDIPFDSLPREIQIEQLLDNFTHRQMAGEYLDVLADYQRDAERFRWLVRHHPGIILALAQTYPRARNCTDPTSAVEIMMMVKK